MTNKPAGTAKRLKELTAELKQLQAELNEANRREGKDLYIEVKVRKNQGNFRRIKQKGVEDKAIGKFYLEIDITAKQEIVFIPISIASGKKVAGFMYQVEGTAEGSLASSDISVRGDGVTQVTLGTLRYAKLAPDTTATFQIKAAIRGHFGKVYKLVFTRLNYKRALTDVRYEQYLKEISSANVKFT